jgi:hypothetical protein
LFGRAYIMPNGQTLTPKIGPPLRPSIRSRNWPGVTYRDGREGPGHESLSDAVAEHLKDGFGHEIRGRIRTGIRALYEARLLADYMPRHTVSEDDARDVLKRATTIATSVRSVLK